MSEKEKIVKKQVYAFNGMYYDTFEDAERAQRDYKVIELNKKVDSFVSDLRKDFIRSSYIFDFIGKLSQEEITLIRQIVNKGN